MSWLTSSISRNLAPLGLHSSPSTALRSNQRMSGLFDTGFTGLEPASPVKTKPDTSEAEELFEALEKGVDLLDADQSDLENVGLASLDMDSDLFEVFTDLSDFLVGENLGSSSAFIGMAEPSEGVQAVKRAAPVADLTTEKLPLNHDHDAYTSKRARLSTTSTIESDDEGVTLTKDEKYFERRKKNNVASKRSRETRKKKYTAMEQKAIDLEGHNDELRKKCEELEKLTKKMKDALVQTIAGRK